MSEVTKGRKRDKSTKREKKETNRIRTNKKRVGKWKLFKETKNQENTAQTQKLKPKM
jgi:hypothetical protein